MPRADMFDRRRMLATMVGAVGFASLPTASRAATQWVLTSGYPDGSHMVRNNRLFAEALASRTGGELTMEVYGNGALYKLPETKRAVQTGQVQMGEVFLGALSNEDPLFGAGTLPFLVKDVSEAAVLWELQKPVVARRFDEQGLMLLHGVTWPGQSLFVKQPIASFADLKNTKFRVQNPSTARLAELMGVVGVRVETADLPQAFLTGIIDGMYTSNATGADVGVWDFCRYIYETNAWYPKNITFMNKSAFDSMPKAIQDVIVEESAIAEKRGWEMEAQATIVANELLRSKGVEILPPPEELMLEFRRIGQVMVEEWLTGAGPAGKDLIDTFRKRVS